MSGNPIPDPDAGTPPSTEWQNRENAAFRPAFDIPRKAVLAADPNSRPAPTGLPPLDALPRRA